MEFYLSFIFIISFFLILDYYIKPKGNFFEYVALLIIIIVTGVRVNVGYDYVNYHDNYLRGYLDPGLEPGYLFFINILRFFGASPYVMFFLMGLGIYSFFYAGIRKYTLHSGIALIIYMLIPGLYLNSLSIIRQELAISIAFFAFYFLEKKNYKKYFLLMLLAFSFHLTVIFVFFIHIIAIKFARKLVPKHYFIFIIISLIFSVLHLEKYVVQYTYSKYTDLMSDGEQVNIVKTIILNSVVILSLFFYKTLCKKERNKYIFFFVVLATIMVNIFSSFTVFTRISYYFRAYEVILIAELVFVFAPKYRSLITFLAFCYYFALFAGSLNNDIKIDYKQESKLTPYKTFLND